MIDFNDAPGSGGGMFEWQEEPNTPVAATLSGEQAEKLLKGLNPPQRAAALHTDGPLMVFAGAGSGKTKMLTARIAWLMAHREVAPQNILAVTFTNKAAAEMRERVSRVIEGAGGQPLTYAPAWGRGFSNSPEIGTFHSVCLRMLRLVQDRTPFSKPFVIYDDQDQLSLIKDVMEKLNIDDKAFSPKAFQAGINRAKCDALEPQDMPLESIELFDRKLRLVYEQYQHDLFGNNALDFGEILFMTYRILKNNPDVRERFQKKYPFVLVDEYQDTNKVQYLLLSQLTSKKFGGAENLCVVGDEDQSIYGWRGADIRNILDFENDFPGAFVVKLEQNYRSTKTIITTASRVIANNSERKDKVLWTDNDQGEPVLAVEFTDERAEADAVVREIRRQIQSENRELKEFAVFYRTHAQSRQFEDVLRRERLNYQIYGGLRFYDRKEIKDVLAYLKVLMNPADSVSLRRIINVPARGIGKTSIEKIELQAVQKGIPFMAALVETAATNKKLASFLAILDRLTDAFQRMSLTELYHQLLDETRYVQELKLEGTDEALARVENLEEFDTVLQEFEEDQLRGVAEDQLSQYFPQLLPSFLEQALLQTDQDREEKNLDSVQLMTLHASKGLEFPVVFMVGLEEGLFPSVKEWQTDEKEIEEERRLCYVGMTRARERLVMTYVNERRIWGQTSFQRPARFFTELPEDLVEFRSLHGGRPQAAPSMPHSTGVQMKNPGRMGDGVVTGKLLDHPDYGSGRILSSEGTGADEKILVEFKGKSQRKFLLRYVKDYVS